jgi:hypothetical protein
MQAYRYTSTVNLLVKWALFILGVAFLAFNWGLFRISLSEAAPMVAPRNSQYIAIVLAFIPPFLAGICIPGNGDDVLDGITCYLYGNFVLFAGLSWADSRRLSEMFASNANRTWYPMTEVVAVDKDLRRKIILDAAKEVGRLGEYMNPNVLSREARWKLPLLFGGSLIYPFALIFTDNQGASPAAIERYLLPAIVPFIIAGVLCLLVWVGYMFEIRQARKEKWAFD